MRGDTHSNTVEGYFSVFKRGLTGTFHHTSPEHFKRHLGEFDFRYNFRVAAGFSDRARAEAVLRGISGKRLIYKGSGQQF